jgi:hypothetical protein
VNLWNFFPKGMDPFKIKTNFKLDLFLEFIIQNPERFVSWAEMGTCSI